MAKQKKMNIEKFRKMYSSQELSLAAKAELILSENVDNKNLCSTASMFLDATNDFEIALHYNEI